MSFPNNEMKVSMHNKEMEYLFAAVPYSEGWKAYDHGKPIKVLKADIGFMALQLEPGEHDIRFVYNTPGFITGLIISLVSVICFSISIILKKKEKHLSKQPSKNTLMC